MSNKKYSFSLPQNKTAFKDGLKDGTPIGLGYFAVSFSLGIVARNAGLTPFQGLLASFLCNASAGEHVGFTMIAASATYIEIALAILIANARYLLMSCALSQKAAPDLPLHHRMIVAFDITDELFGITIARDGYLNPYYTYGAMTTSIPFWAIGTMLGVIAGNLLPLRLVSALSVALYGMFLAVIIPPARKDKVITGIIVISFALSLAASYIPYICDLAEGTRTVILTVIIASAAAILFPKTEGSGENEQ